MTKATENTPQISFVDPLQVKLVNCLMKGGKKTIAQRILKDAFGEIAKQGKNDPIKTLEVAVENTKPITEVKSKRIGGSVYQIPIDVPEKRRLSLSLRWLLEGARKRRGIPMYRCLAQELLEASNESGYAFNKKEEVHRMAQANRAFAHLARY